MKSYYYKGENFWIILLNVLKNQKIFVLENVCKFGNRFLNFWIMRKFLIFGIDSKISKF